MKTTILFIASLTALLAERPSNQIPQHVEPLTAEIEPAPPAANQCTAAIDKLRTRDLTAAAKQFNRALKRHENFAAAKARFVQAIDEANRRFAAADQRNCQQPKNIS
jgi:hypothetical protein